MRLSVFGSRFLAAAAVGLLIAAADVASAHAAGDREAACFAIYGKSCAAQFGAVTLQAVLQPFMIAAAAALGTVAAWPLLRSALREGWAYLAGAAARGRGWCLRLVQDLQPPRFEHLGLVPRFMTGYGPQLA